MEEIPPILCGIRIRKLVDVNIRMGRSPVGFKAVGSQKCRIIVSALILISPRKTTEQPAAFPAMVTNRSAEFSHANHVCQDQEQENETDSTSFVVGIPDMQPFALKCRDMSETREQEQVKILWFLWTRDNPSR